MKQKSYTPTILLILTLVLISLFTTIYTHELVLIVVPLVKG